jgi:hypothetical protein
MGAQKKRTLLHDSGGTPIPEKTMQTEYANRVAHSKQKIFSSVLWRFPESIRLNCELLFHLYFSCLFSPLVDVRR